MLFRSRIQVQLSNRTLKPGLYWLDISWDLGGFQTISVEVLGKGAMTIYGKMLQFTIDKAVIQEGDTVSMNSQFSNDGEEYIDKAVLNVEVHAIDEKSGKTELKEAVKSDPYSAPKAATINLTAYYAPQHTGKYLLKAYVAYSGKKTRTTQANLEVLEKPRSYLVQYILLGIVFILASYYLIRRKPKETLDPVTREFKKDWGNFIHGK